MEFNTTIPAERIVELELDETLAPVAAAAAAAASAQPATADFTGAAVLALVCAVGGLFWFGLLLGFVSVVLAVRCGPWAATAAARPRGVAMAALMLAPPT